MALRFSMILQAIDRVTGPAKRVSAGVRQMTAGVRQMARANAAATAPTRRLDGGVRALAAGFGVAGRAAKRWAGRAGLKSWGDAAEKAGRATGGLLRKLGGMGVTAAKWAGAAAVGAGGFALFDLFKTASQFEQYQIMLEGLMGSAAKGKVAMNWISSFAAETPFELDQVTKAFMKLKNAGLDPTNGSLLAAGDAASGMSEDILRAAEAMADAMTGEFERLKDLGITASVAGDQVKLSWVKNEKEFTKVASKADKVGLAMAVAAAWSDKFEGSTKRQSKSLAGIISNLKDSWSRFLVMVANAGIFDLVKTKLEGILTKVNDWAKNGQLEVWAKQVSDQLENAFNWGWRFVNDTNWGQVGSDIKSIASAVGTIATGLRNAYGWATLLGKVLSFGDSIDSWIGRQMGIGGRSAQPSFDTGGSEVERRDHGAILSRRLRQARPLSKPRSFFGPPRSSRPAVGRKVSQQDVNVGGQVQIEVRAVGGASARLRSASSDNRAVPLIMNLGRSMGGPA